MQSPPVTGEQKTDVSFLPGLDYQTIRRALHQKYHGLWCAEWEAEFAEWEERIVPHIGCGATKGVGTDHYPYIVTRIGKGTSRARIWVKRLHAVGDGTIVGFVPGGFILSEDPDPDAPEYEVRWSRGKLGWYLHGFRMSFAGASQRLDPHF